LVDWGKIDPTSLGKLCMRNRNLQYFNKLPKQKKTLDMQFKKCKSSSKFFNPISPTSQILFAKLPHKLILNDFDKVFQIFCVNI
jgi:hypothetical protein